MAENKKIYEIVINGLKQSFDDTIKLTDALKAMDDAINRQRSVVSEYDNVLKQKTTTNDELAKTEQKLANFSADYQKAVEANKSVISDFTAQVKQQVKEENAWATIEANVTDTYRDKQKLLSALGTVIRGYNAQTEEERAELQELKVQYATINTELKAFDKEMGNAYRNVGNYAEGVTQGIEASTGLKSQLKEIAQQMQVLASNGQKGTEQWNELAKKAGKLKDAISDASTAINKYASDSKALDDVISVATTATGAFGVYTSTMKLFGEENEEVAKSIEKLEAVQTALQSLQALSNQLTTDGTMANTMYHAVLKMLNLEKEAEVINTEASTVAEEANLAVTEGSTVAKEANTVATLANTTEKGANTTATVAGTTAQVANTTATVAGTTATKGLTVAQKAGAVASKLLGNAMKAIPIMFLIGLIMSLISYWDELVGWFNKVIGVSKDGSTAMEKLGSVIKGVGNVIVQWLINPFKTFTKVMGKLVKGDFKGALSEVTNGIKEQFNLAKHYSDSYTKSEAKNAEARRKKNAEESAKQTKYELDELKAREGNSAKYSKKGIELQKKEFEERKKAAKGNEEEMKKIHLEELNFNRECKEEETRIAKAEQDKRTAEAKKSAEARKNAEKEALEEQKKLDEKYNKALKDFNDNTTKGYEEALTTRTKIAREGASGFADTLDDIFKVPLSNEDLKRLEDFKDRLENISELYNHFYAFGNKLDKALHNEGFDREVEKISEKIKGLLGSIDNYKDMLPNDFLRGFTSEMAKVQTDFEVTTKKIWDDANELYENLRIKNQDLPENPLQEWIKNLNNSKNTEFRLSFIEEYETWLKDAPLETLDSSEKIKKIVGQVFTSLNTNYQNYTSNWDNVQKQWIDIAKKSTTKINDILKKNLKIDKGNLNDSLSEYNSFLDKFKEATTKFNSDGIFTKGLRSDIKALNSETSNIYKTFVANGIDNLDKLKAQWDKYIKEVALVYGKDSDEYLNAQKDKEKALKDFRKTAEKAQTDLQKNAEDNYKKATDGLRSDVKELGDDITSMLKSLFGDNFWESIFGNAGAQMAKAFGTGLQAMSMGMDAYSDWLDFAIEEAEDKVDILTDLYEDAVEKVEKTTDRIKDINDAILKAEGSRKEELKDQLADEQLLLLQEQAQEKKAQEEKEKAEAELEAKKKQQRKMELSTQMVIGIADTASAVLSTFKQWGWPLGAVFGGIIGALGAAQVAVIGKQMSKLRDGGLIGTDGISRSHEQGGHKIEGTNIEVEGGEWVINRNSSAKYNDLLEAINNDNTDKVRTMTGLKFADGGQLDIEAVDNTLQSVSVEAQMLRAIEGIDMHPVVSVVDINKGQKNLARVQSYAGRR